MATLEPWRRVWREGFVPQFSRGDLLCLLEALEEDDPRLIQGGLTNPPMMQCISDWPPEAACALGYIGWKSQGNRTVEEVERWFGLRCFYADRGLRWDGLASCDFLHFFDDTPRDLMRHQLAAEIRYNLHERFNYVATIPEEVAS